jgi:hypothetical protein
MDQPFDGLSKFNPATKIFTNFGINDGLQSREFKMNSCYLNHNGKCVQVSMASTNSFG